MNPPNLSHRPCGCTRRHARRRVVLTGGPGAGKTALLEFVRQSFCPHVSVLPEAASIVFGGGFPRGDGIALRRAEQRAIFYVQRELEAVADGGDAAVVLCDRCTVDGGAYWPGPGELWSSVGTTLAEQLARYDTVIHLRTPADGQTMPLHPFIVHLQIGLSFGELVYEHGAAAAYTANAGPQAEPARENEHN